MLGELDLTSEEMLPPHLAPFRSGIAATLGYFGINVEDRRLHSNGDSHVSAAAFTVQPSVVYTDIQPSQPMKPNCAGQLTGETLSKLSQRQLLYCVNPQLLFGQQ